MEFQYHDEFILNVNLKKDTPKEIIDTLGYLTYPELLPKPDKFPEHTFFNDSEFEIILHNEDHTFPGMGHAVMMFDKDANKFYLSTRNVLSTKLGAGVIEHFLQWIKPYIVEETKSTEMLIALTRSSLSPDSVREYFIVNGKLMTRFLTPNALDGTREV